jgi:signal transduction histidine kinase/ligand-binding sensor domain-containing protein
MLVAVMRAPPRALGLLFLFASLAGAQTASGTIYQIDHYTVENGLAQNSLRAVARDRTGFIWVGGFRGLQRFDGHTFVRYAALDPQAPPELTRQIGVIRNDARGDPWVEASERLFRFDAAAQRFKRIDTPARILAGVWAPDSSGGVWAVHADTVYRLEPDSLARDGIRARAAYTGPWVRNVVGLASSSSGGVWLRIASPRGDRIARVRAGARTFVDASLVGAPRPRVLVEDGDGNLWIAGDGGVAKLDSTARHMRAVGELAGQSVMWLGADGRHGLLALSDAGLTRVERDGRVDATWRASGVFGVGNLPQSFAFDRDGGLWLATLTAGLYRLDVRAPVFHFASSQSSPPIALDNDFVTTLAEGPDSSLWVGTLRGGAYRLTAPNNVVQSIRHDRRAPASLPSDEVWKIVVDDDGTVWIATAAGLCAAERSGVHCYGPSTGVVDLTRDREGWLWLACGDRVMSFDPRTRRFAAIIAVSARALTVFADTTSSEIWVAGELLRRARVSRGRLADSLQEVGDRSHSHDLVYQIHRDSAGVLWMATDLGLERVAPEDETHTTLVNVPALAAVTVFAIAEDSARTLWLGTSHGLVHYSPLTGVAHRYGRQDGILTGEFNRHAVASLFDGQLVFGGVEGLVRFRPALVPLHASPSPVVFTHLRRVTDDGIVDAPIDRLHTVTLDRHDRAITVDFAALAFGVSEARRYRFRLIGSGGATWIETNDHTVTYSALPAGAYRLQVEASIGEADWGEPASTLAIEVVPPLWRTRWFEALVGVAFGALIFLLHRLSLGRALATERLRLRISRDLHDEIGAGLSSIALLSDTASSDPRLGDPARAQMRRIGKSARSMVDDLRDIIWAIDPGADHVDDVVGRMRDLVSMLLPGLRVTFAVPDAKHLDDRITMTARRDLLLIFKEILNNVARHAHATEARITLTMSAGALVLCVADDGRGFTPANARRGTGLRSMQERARRLGAEFALESAPGRGTIVRLTVRKTRMRRSRATVAH